MGVAGKALARVVQCGLVYDAAPEDLKPFAAEEDFDLEARRRPRKGCLDPPHSERVLRRRADVLAKKG